MLLIAAMNKLSAGFLHRALMRLKSVWSNGKHKAVYKF
jgi:hypothetical protein